MIGRGAYGRPWFVAQAAAHLRGIALPDPTLQEQRQIMLEHYTAMLDMYGEANGIRIARKHIGWYVSGLPNSAEFRHSVNKMTDTAQVIGTIHQYYDMLEARGITSRAHERVTEGE